MFRKNVMQGGCLICLGMGLLLGCNASSRLLCCAGGAVLVLLGLWLMKHR